MAKILDIVFKVTKILIEGGFSSDLFYLCYTPYE
jgi:hypothetical protein